MEFLVLEVDGARFGIPTSDVREVVRAASLSAAPTRLPQMLGMLNYRGQVLGVLELACLRGQTHRELTPRDHLIILQSAEHFFAVRVDRAVDIMTWAKDDQPDHQPPGSDVPSSDNGVHPIAHPCLGVVYLLDTETLWRELHHEEGGEATDAIRQATQKVEAG